MATVTLIIVALFLVPCSAFMFGTKVLYDPNDPIVQLNSSTLRATLYKSERAWTVEFYNSWCGHCVSFAPTWIQLATDVQKWKSVIDIAAIDCAVEENTAACRHFEIYGYPTIKFFKPFCEDDDLGSTLKTTERDITSLRQLMVDFVNLHNTPNSKWPKLNLINNENLDQAWKDIYPSVNKLAVIFEDPPTYFAQEIILDCSRLRSFVEVRRLSPNSTFVHHLDTSTIPIVHIFDRMNYKPINRYTGTREEIVEKLEKLAREQGFDPDQTTLSPVRAEELVNEDKKLQEAVGADDNRKEDVETESTTKFTTVIEADHAYEQELENTINYMFHHEVSIQKDIKYEKVYALRDWIKVLDKHYPGRYAATVVLSKLVEYVDIKSEIKGEDFQKEFTSILGSQGGSPFKMRDWISCKRTVIHLTGYTCGLWTLFHTLTVSAYKKNPNDVDSHLEVLRAIRGYVSSFMGCKACAEHFSEMTKNIEYEVSKPDDSVLWLWQAHNRVNLRLKGSPSDDPHHPKVQFPTMDMCPNCQTSSNDGTQWDLSAVMDLLVYHYGSMGIVPLTPEDVILASDPQEKNISKEVGKRSAGAVTVEEPRKVRETGWDFTAVDISMCVFLYVVSLLILLAGYFCIILRRRSILNQIKRRTLQYINLV